ncbi:hypothetical protein K1719_010533 [Acacia pycnantha]|nr:hypothetical protein K1719_010533 [Acacia pycnantha]
MLSSANQMDCPRHMSKENLDRINKKAHWNETWHPSSSTYIGRGTRSCGPLPQRLVVQDSTSFSSSRV